MLIDVDLAGCLTELRHLQRELCTVDLVLRELDSLVEEDLRGTGITVLSLAPAEVAELMDARSRHRALSVGDAAGLVVARHHGAILLTGDAALREAAEHAHVEVHGTLWVLRELVRAGRLTASAAREIVMYLRDNGRRLPAAPEGYFEK